MLYTRDKPKNKKPSKVIKIKGYAKMHFSNTIKTK